MPRRVIELTWAMRFRRCIAIQYDFSNDQVTGLILAHFRYHFLYFRHHALEHSFDACFERDG